jgi:hypothetical protein
MTLLATATVALSVTALPGCLAAGGPRAPAVQAPRMQEGGVAVEQQVGQGNVNADVGLALDAALARIDSLSARLDAALVRIDKLSVSLAQVGDVQASIGGGVDSITSIVLASGYALVIPATIWVGARWRRSYERKRRRAAT